MPVEAAQHLSFMLPLARGTVRMIGCSLSLKVMPLITSFFDGWWGWICLGAISTWGVKGVKGAVMGPGFCCQMVMVQVMGTWAHDLSLSVPLVPPQ